jgi:hypothetical protein
MRKLAPPLLVVALAVHLAMLAGWRWPFPVAPYFFDSTVLSGGRGLDFYSIYQAGYNARHSVDIYENNPAKAPIVVPYFTPYRYLPVVAYTVGAALSLFAWLTAYKIWLVIVELTLAACVWLAWRSTRDRRLGMLLAAMWLGFTPYYLELFMGQFSMVQAALTFGMLLLTFGSSALGDNPSAAFQVESLWVASILWKINTIVFAPVFFRLRRYRALLAAGLAVALVTLPYFAVFPAHALDFLRNNFGGSVSAHELGNLGFRQLVFELLTAWGVPAAVQSIAQSLTVLIVLIVCLGVTFPVTFSLRPSAPASDMKRAAGSGGQRRIFSLGPLSCFYPPAASPISTLLCLWLTAFFLVSPQIWENHYLMLLPALVITLRQTWGKSEAWFVIFIWLLIALPTPFGFTRLSAQIAANHDLRAFPLSPVWQLLWEHACKAVPALLFFGYLAASAVTRQSDLTERVSANTRAY